MTSSASKTIEINIDIGDSFWPLLEPSRYKGAHGGRGGGKSHFFADILIEKASWHPVRIVCLREYQKSLAHSVKTLLERKIAKQGVGERFDIQKTQIIGASGSLIIFEGMQSHNADSIKSLEDFDIAYFAEAHRASDYSLEILRPTLRNEGSELWFDWNRTDPKNPVERLFYGDEASPDSIVIESNYNNNPWFPEVLRKEMLYDRGRDADRFEHIWGGKFRKHSMARVFSNWVEESFDTPEGVWFYFGADWGFSIDPTVLVRMWIKGRTIYIDQEAYQVGCEIDNTPALFAGTDKQSPARWENPKGLGGISGACDWRITADSARPETISYIKKRGFNIGPAKKGAGSIEDGIEFLKSYDIKVHPRCRHCIDELTYYSYVVDKLTGEVSNVLEDKKNNVIDAIRYALENVRRLTQLQLRSL